MANKNLKTFLFISILLISATSLRASGWTSGFQIVHLNTYNDVVYVKVASGINPDNCPTTDNYYVLAKTDPSFKEKYASLLAAKISKSTLTLWLNGCSSSRPNIFAVVVH